MEITNLTIGKEQTEIMFVLMEDLNISNYTRIDSPIECILLDTNQPYTYKEEVFVLDVMYFKFSDKNDNCIALGKFNGGKL